MLSEFRLDPCRNDQWLDYYEAINKSATKISFEVFSNNTDLFQCSNKIS